MPDSLPTTTRRLIVEGRVQGVGFRWFTRERARRLGLRGWVRNNSNGTVEILAWGPVMVLDRFVEDLRGGPRGAHVEAIRAITSAESRDVGAVGFDAADRDDARLPFPFAIHR